MSQNQNAERLPFHKWVVAALPKATKTDMKLFARQLKEIKLPAGSHEEIIAAWRKRRDKLKIAPGINGVVVALDADKEAVAKATTATAVEAPTLKLAVDKGGSAFI